MKYDVVIIGGGPSGMMAAGRAGSLGARVLLLEKNGELGVKLLITGKGRCNFAHNELDARKFIEKFGKNGKFLFSGLFRFGVPDTIDFFERQGVKTKVERGNRVFPVSDRSQDVLNALVGYMRKSRVDVRTSAEVKRIVKVGKKIEKVVLVNGDEIFADKFIICTGGKSYPATGSTGDGYKWLMGLGHKIEKTMPALSPVIIKENFVKNLEGLSLKNVEIGVYKDGKRKDSRFGEALFTNRGMSGPIVLDMSKEINKNLPCVMQIDFKPALSFQELDKRVQRDFKEMNNKMFKNSLDKLLPKKLTPIIIELSGISPEKQVNLITKEERKKLIYLLKEFKLEVRELAGYSKAIITSGGVSLREIDPKTMKSKLIDNLYLCGEVLDLDGPTGGYNLQVCWTTGFVAGESVC
ncbi:hypothetical protein A2331_05825 [Candidatus Falkowbacteria bacterium RIFOXYB2_FULL_34_18]|uniref:FAD-dependent oxidoreductase n=1 Tax=Candidatus Falkowbacteria bacterium RIFOXYD2_FULL_34_120 TaxID=1798007 RepID=A0A1F5TLX4_9BACT|nr:MAG: hypothetical protein A2331_05825 [Candidatus Falkowbacteria bacterium RIFOXYB2_FULL_34_18]OGF29164.1 MAG: hypothetical protein A2500_05770 [Candidatus Falkowbacteria bacterium RIFOXYC12_FULL_34_55]OGF36970.1 MAG: hypothetical protein A2466_07150 [Candidatus Falkowbacteria bacterium RIFOXYC2_FULL_34_220]OGF38686.1 MAG: hypothetical protein A2515_01435 [Candidatus Falkowbacteria bacterium RIFOXYD12_FULL_34_57]OGF39920.1 MAG: hypothetical protein A2531_01690 [Candidatus Falkowbacteria bact